MPRKTKKQKILAKYRYKLKLLEKHILNKENLINKAQKSLNSNLSSKPIIIKEEISKKNLQDHSLLLNRKYFFQDLKKSFFLSLFILLLIFGFFYLKII